jgi:predicted DNA-binding transcriptional regulator AlpA
MNSNLAEKRLADYDAVMKMFALKSPQSVRNFMARGTLPRPIKLGRKTLWIQSELDAAFDKLQRATA